MTLLRLSQAFTNFYPRPPRGGRPNVQPFRRGQHRFLSTPSARRATWLVSGDVFAVVFLSTPSARRATYTSASHWRDIDISIHALREEGDDFHESQIFVIEISIHALREEGDRHHHRRPDRSGISIHALREEGDAAISRRASASFSFLSTPSARRATLEGCVKIVPLLISIHALREEGDLPRSTRP